MSESRREAALTLSTSLLEDIEMSRISASDLIRKTSRLARLLDDQRALSWLKFEIQGYPSPLNAEAVTAAERSGRAAKPRDLPKDAEGSPKTSYWVASVEQLQAQVEACRLRLVAAQDPSHNITSANPSQYVSVPGGNGQERQAMMKSMVESQSIIGSIVGALHECASEKEVELRFGHAVEGAFEAVRQLVDSQIASLVPDAATKLAAAFESSSSDNPEHWANASSVCRRLIKAVADALREPGPPVAGRTMTDDRYINRLIDWIENQGSIGDTMKDVISADLSDFGKRIDAFDDAGHKGAHAEVTKYESARFVTGTYLLIGDILQISSMA